MKDELINSRSCGVQTVFPLIWTSAGYLACLELAPDGWVSKALVYLPSFEHPDHDDALHDVNLAGEDITSTVMSIVTIALCLRQSVGSRSRVVE